MPETYRIVNPATGAEVFAQATISRERPDGSVVVQVPVGCTAFNFCTYPRDWLVPVANYERMLRRLLVLNNYGYAISTDARDIDGGRSEFEFLSDEWLREWYGGGRKDENWCRPYVQDELDAVDLLMSARS